MGKIKKGILGGFSGKVGTVVDVCHPQLLCSKSRKYILHTREIR